MSARPTRPTERSAAVCPVRDATPVRELVEAIVVEAEGRERDSGGRSPSDLRPVDNPPSPLPPPSRVSEYLGGEVGRHRPLIQVGSDVRLSPSFTLELAIHKNRVRATLGCGSVQGQCSGNRSKPLTTCPGQIVFSHWSRGKCHWVCFVWRSPSP
ncbi:hypothetical protein BaRGS_00018889 [Batillaria attramentaria]|uniref:Uncharacterized protein n=1 Tax=Batillaria attramentaria TaxID=370345 RepID=A0ABD0KSY6_9CAEN